MRICMLSWTESASWSRRSGEGAERRRLRRPRRQGSLSASWSFGRGSVGATLVAVGARADSDFVGLGLTRNAGYARLDARARVQVAGALEAFLAADNLLDARYQEVLGYPALGRALRGGLRLALGGRP